MLMKKNVFCILLIILISTLMPTGCFSDKKNSEFDNYFNNISKNTNSLFSKDKDKDKDKRDENKKKEELDKKYCAVCGLEIQGTSKISEDQVLCESCWINRTNLGFRSYNSPNKEENKENEDNKIEEETDYDENENIEDDNEEENTVPPPVYSDPSVCCLCGNRLEKYWLSNNLKYCPDCYDKYIVQKCARCNNVLTQYYKVKKKKYCRDCYENYIVERCAHCNTKLLGKYFKTKQKKYCPNCYENYIVEKCYYCHKILDKYYKGKNGKTCPNCYIAYEVPRCIVCHNPIMEKYYNFPTGKCCLDCFQKNPHCFNCGLPTKFPAFQDEDFIICSNCNKEKITTKEDLAKLYDKVKLYVKKSCGISIDIPVNKIVLMSSEDLKDRTKNIGYLSGQRVLGFCYTQYTMTKFYDKRFHTIYLQNGMPYELAFGTLAHEYGHAWDHQNKKLEVMKTASDHSFSEGFAEWVKYYTIKEYGFDKKAEEMLGSNGQEEDPIYGTGFKNMMKLEKEFNSKSAFLEYVKNNNTFKD